MRMRRNCHQTTSGQISNPNFETPMGCFLFDYDWWRFNYYKIYACFVQKTAFVMHFFSEFGDQSHQWGKGKGKRVFV